MRQMEMEMEEDSTRDATVISGTTQEDDSVVASWLIVDDKTESELSKLLDLFETPPPPMKVRFIEDLYSSAVLFQSSSAYVTINGNEESCGSSFSDSDSSVMASIDLGSARRSGGSWFSYFDEARERWMERSIGEADIDVEFGEVVIDGCDYSDDAEDPMWQEFLGEIFG